MPRPVTLMAAAGKAIGHACRWTPAVYPVLSTPIGNSRLETSFAISVFYPAVN
jgi:hypothetical protein